MNDTNDIASTLSRAAHTYAPNGGSSKNDYNAENYITVQRNLLLGLGHNTAYQLLKKKQSAV